MIRIRFQFNYDDDEARSHFRGNDIPPDPIEIVLDGDGPNSLDSMTRLELAQRIAQKDIRLGNLHLLDDGEFIIVYFIVYRL